MAHDQDPTRGAGLSLVIPMYNKAPYIRRAIESALNQAVRPTEIIIIDDGSSDGCGDVAREYAGQGINVHWQPNQGVAAARNNGVQCASCDWVALLDADDAWQRGMTEELIALTKAYPEAGLVGTAFEFSDSGQVSGGAAMLMAEGFRQGVLTNYFRVAPLGLPFCASSVAVRREVFLSLGGFARVWGGEDPDLWLRIALQHPVAYSTKVGATYHRGMPTQFSSLQLSQPFPQAVVSARRLMDEGHVDAAVSRDLAEYVNRLLLWHVGYLRRAGQRREALSLLWQCKGTHRFRKEWCGHALKALVPRFE